MREYARNEGTNQTTVTTGGRKKEEMKTVHIQGALEHVMKSFKSSLMNSWVEGRFVVVCRMNTYLTS